MHIWGGLKQPDNALDKWLQLFIATLVLAVMLGHNFHIFEAHLVPPLVLSTRQNLVL